MKKICYIVNSDWYFDLHWLERAIAAKMAGYEVHVVCRFSSKKFFNEFRALGIICHQSYMLEHSLHPLRFVITMARIWWIIRKINPHIIHCITIKACLIGGMYARIFNKNLILSFVGLGRVFTDKKSYIFLRMFAITCYRIIFRNKRCFLVFEHDKDRLKLLQFTNFDSERVFVIAGAGVNLDKFHYTSEPTKEVPVVLFAGRLLWSKGLDKLVKIRKKLLKRKVYFLLKVAGFIVEGDKDNIPMKQIIHWQKEGSIVWVGKSDDVPSLIREANVVALPSTYPEGLPRILLEASAMGRACIAYNSGGSGDIIIDGYNGSLVEMEDIESFCDKLQQLLENPDLRNRMGSRGRALVGKRYSSSIVVRETLSLYDQVAKA